MQKLASVAIAPIQVATGRNGVPAVGDVKTIHAIRWVYKVCNSTGCRLAGIKRNPGRHADGEEIRHRRVCPHAGGVGFM